MVHGDLKTFYPPFYPGGWCEIQIVDFEQICILLKISSLLHFADAPQSLADITNQILIFAAKVSKAMSLSCAGRQIEKNVSLSFDFSKRNGDEGGLETVKKDLNIKTLKHLIP